jgi:hypothetical protein
MNERPVMEQGGQPSGIAVAAASPVARTSAPLVIGILSIVFGGLGLVPAFGYASFECGRAVSTSHDRNDDEERTTRDWGPEVGGTVLKAWKAWKAVAAPAGLAVAALSAVLLAVGIGQLRYRRWARRAAILWAIAALAVLVALVVVFIAVVGPAQSEAMRAMEQARSRLHAVPRFEDLGTMVSFSGAVILLFSLAPYPIVLLILSTRRFVVEAMRR